MKSPIFFAGSIALIMLARCKHSTSPEMTIDKNNPLIREYDTPLGVPPFDKIKNKHYKPALEWAMSDHKREIDSIANIKDEPSFENTVAAMDAAGAALQRVSNVFYNLAQAHTNDTLRKLEEEMAPE